MRLTLSLLAALLAAYLTLAWVSGHLDTVSASICSVEFTLPGIACRFAGLGITLLMIPVAGVLAGFIAWRSLP